jgi:hypothetical protein
MLPGVTRAVPGPLGSIAAMSDPGARPDRRGAVVVGLLVAVTVGCWILLIPPSGGPDEPSHLVRAAALVRGVPTEEVPGSSALVTVEVPAWTGFPDPGCWAFQPTVPVACATSLPLPGGDAPLLTKASDYPLWGHLAAGVASLVEWPAGAAYLARVLHAAAPVLLLTGAVVAATRSSRLRGAAVLLAATPMVWFTLAIVNPSSLAVAGAIALWVALLDDRPGAAVTGSATRAAGWLLALGWAATVLPRRDGLVWGSVVVALVVLVADRPVIGWWRGLTWPPRVVVVAATLVAVAFGVASGSRVNRLVVLAPLAVIAAEVLRRVIRRIAERTPPPARPTARIAALLAALAALATVGLTGIAATRPGGFDLDLFRKIVGQTGVHLREAIGVLGWLDTFPPAWVIVLWLVAFGVLVGAALATAAARGALLAAAVLAVGAVLPWFLELVQGNDTGTYWQGRYTLPLLVGAPLALAAAAAPSTRGGAGEEDGRGLAGDRILAPAATDRVATVVAAASVVVLDVTAWSAVRRWAVGVEGTWLPWRWDTYDTPLPPILVLVVLAASSAALAAVVAGARRLPGGGDASR